MRPTIGRIVLYVNRYGEHPEEHSPAIVSRVWSDICVNLHVMTQDPVGVPLKLETSRMLDESATPQPGTWHWPPKV